MTARLFRQSWMYYACDQGCLFGNAGFGRDRAQNSSRHVWLLENNANPPLLNSTCWWCHPLAPHGISLVSQRGIQKPTLKTYTLTSFPFYNTTTVPLNSAMNDFILFSWCISTRKYIHMTRDLYLKSSEDSEPPPKKFCWYNLIYLG